MDKLYNDQYLQRTTEFINALKKISHDMLSPKIGDAILEIGCGNGYDAIELSKRVGSQGKIIGIDIDSELVKSSSKNAKANNCTNVEFIQGNAENLPFDDNSFNHIRSERVFQHLFNPNKVVEEAFRVLKPGGTFLLMETDWCGMNIYISNKSLESKLIKILTEQVLNNGLASRNLISYLQKNNFYKTSISVHPILIENYQTAEQIIKFSNIISVGKKLNIISAEEANEWEFEIKKLTENNCFVLSTNMIIVCGKKV